MTENGANYSQRRTVGRSTPSVDDRPDCGAHLAPADERCKIGELTIRYDSNSLWPELSGELFTIRPMRVDEAPMRTKL
ncbi:hypothetical protein BST16_09225 [Mycobacterium asiaticum DSM 44297]|nr:hypothetical protein BST16_09225 [Mycobacterium asiaticum DSM 44297]